MKTSQFLAALERFGWYVARSGKHVLLGNRYFQPVRPVALSYSDMRRIEPDLVENTAKCVGLVWKDHHDEPVPNPKHPYYQFYRQAGLAQ